MTTSTRNRIDQAALDRERRSQDALLSELRAAGAKINNPKSFCCPFHEDRSPSAGVYCEDDGVWRYKCQVPSCGIGGDVFDIRARIAGKPVAEVLPFEAQGDEQAKAKPAQVFPTIEALTASIRGRVDGVFQYVNPDNNAIELVVIKWFSQVGPKRFIQASPVPGGFVMKAPPKPWPLYNRGRLKAAREIVVVEGEQCVHRCHEVGIVATTSPGGAGKASLADWSPLAGKEIFIWPDNDPADAKTGQRTGIAHMREVARILSTLDPAPRVNWIDPDRLNLPPKGDVCDYLAMHQDLDRQAKKLLIENVMIDAESLGVSGELKSLIDDIASGKRRMIDWPWPQVSRLTKALLPGTVTIIVADPGAGKSFAVLQAAAYQHEQGIKVAVLMLEEDRRYHLHRALAQRSGNSLVLDDNWIRDNKDQAETLFLQHESFIDSFGRCLTEASEAHDNLKAVSDWVTERAMAGCRVIYVDPVTAADTGDKRWIEDLKFIKAVKQTAVQFDCSIVLATHPRGGRNNRTTLDSIAGSLCFPRFCQCVLWLEHLNPPKAVTVANNTAFGTDHQTVRADRILKIRKSRNGNGSGMQIAMHMQGSSLSFSELGVIVADDDPQEAAQ